MSLSAALSSAVSGLTAQSKALAAISENIANASTTAYKTKETSFSTLVSGSLGTGLSSASVLASSSQLLAKAGEIAPTTTTTNVAISGNGFFVVTGDPSAASSNDVYTRDGSFSQNSSGYLTNSQGFYLTGFATDANGTILASNTNDLTGLQAVNLASIGGTAKATSNINMSANLPADAPIPTSLTTSMEIIDSLGVSHTIGQTWTKTAANTWTLDLASPTKTGTTSPASGAVTPNSFAVTFNPDGTLASTAPALTLSVSGLTSGAADSTIGLNLGTVGGTDGITQYASTSSTMSIENPTITQDGALYGELSSVDIAASGLVTAKFDNGISMAVYQIPIATFSNPNGLTLISGTTYDENNAAGQVMLNMPGRGGAGTMVASALESSNTDIATEFNKMIVAQQAYSASSQVVSTVKSMYDTLLQSVR